MPIRPAPDGRLDRATPDRVPDGAAATDALVFLIIGSTDFAYGFKALGGDHLFDDLLRALESTMVRGTHFFG